MDIHNKRGGDFYCSHQNSLPSGHWDIALDESITLEKLLAEFKIIIHEVMDKPRVEHSAAVIAKKLQQKKFIMIVYGAHLRSFTARYYSEALLFWIFEFRIFDIVSNFGIRISDFCTR